MFVIHLNLIPEVVELKYHLDILRRLCIVVKKSKLFLEIPSLLMVATRPVEDANSVMKIAEPKSGNLLCRSS